MILRFFVLLALFAAISFFVVPILTSSRPAETSAAQASAVTVERGSFEVRVQVMGELQPVRSTTISSEIKSDRGKIIELIDDGSEVAAGDVLVRFDATPFEEELRAAELDVALAESIVEARSQALEWEKVQAERRIQTAQYELELAALEQHRLEKGEGPLELARLESEYTELDGTVEEQAGFLDELEQLLALGHVNDAEVSQVKKRANKARQTAELARRQYETYRDFILPTRKAALKHKVEQADMELQQTKVSAQYKVGESQASLQQAQRDLDAARAQLEQARSELDRTVLRAPAAGIVVQREEFRDGVRRKPRVGDSVWQNQPLLFLPDLSQMIVDTRVREVDMHKVEPGNRGVARLDAYPELDLPAEVQAIGVLAEREAGMREGEKAFRVSIELLEEDPRLRPGMTARVDILSATVEDALVVPIQALWERDGATWCYVLENGQPVRRDVVIGARSRHQAEVREGLAEGERVSLVAPESGEL